MPFTVPAAGKSNNFTLTTTGKVTIAATAAVTLGREQSTPTPSNYPTITLNAGSVGSGSGVGVIVCSVINKVATQSDVILKVNKISLPSHR